MMRRLGISSHDGIFVAGMALLLVLFSAAVVGATADVTAPVPLQMQPLPGSSSDLRGDALLLPGGATREVASRLRFNLPAPDPGQSRWVLWVERDQFDAIWLQGRGPAGDAWRSATLDFFAPAAGESPLSTGFMFPLPSDWQGEVSLELHARGAIRAALRPRLMQEAAALRREHLAIALSFAVYAGLFMLALIALVLYSAARERGFLAAFGSTLATLLLLAAANGHLFQLPGFHFLAAWGAQAIWALALLFSAAVVHLLLRYAGLRDGLVPAAHVFIDRYCVVLIALAALCMLDLSILQPFTQPVATVAWVVAGCAGAWVMADARWRHVPMAGSILALVLLSMAAALAFEAMARGYLPDVLWLRYGYQLALVLTLSTLTLGLLSRIGEYREQRDRDQLARADTERRMSRESARTELALELQKRLREQEPDDIEWSALHLLLEHLLPQVPAETAIAWTRGYHGRDALVVAPAADKAAVQRVLASRELMIKRLALQGTPLQQPLAAAQGDGGTRIEALIPLAIRAPGWGMVMLQRNGNAGFSNEEMTLAREFARLTVLNADEALAATQLRRSAEVDALTGTFNRRTIDQWLGRSFAEAHRDRQVLSLLFIDIDHFKAINDRYGHACGDLCLRQIAATLRAALGEGDLLGRYGGEEFIAVLPGRGGADARAVAEQLRAAVEHHQIQWKGQVLRLTVSVGLAMRLPDEGTPAATVERADKALYTAKRSGRNCVQVAPAVFS